MKLRAIVFGVFVIIIGYRIFGETYYVAENGNDANPGTKDKPFRTINKASEKVKAGDTVLVSAGIYPGNITINSSGEENKPIVFKKYDNGEVQILGKVEKKTGFVLSPCCKYTYEVEEKDDGQVAINLDTTKLVIEYLERVNSIDKVEASNYRFYYDKNTNKLYIRYLADNPEKGNTIHVVKDAYGMRIVSGQHILIDGFTFSGFFRNGIEIEGSKNITIQNCKISLAGFGWGAGIRLGNTDSINIKNCMIYRVMNGIMLEEAIRSVISHVTIYKTRAHGIIMYKSPYTTVKNNIIFAGGPSGNALYIVDNLSTNGLQLDYNCYLSFYAPFLIVWEPVNGKFPTFWDYRAKIKDQDVHSISDDPMFISTEQYSENFNLTPESPCVGKAEDGSNMGVIFSNVK